MIPFIAFLIPILQDRPHEVAEVIAGYMIRNKFAEAVGGFTSYSPCC